MRHTLSVQNIKNTFRIFSWTPTHILPSEQPQSVGAWTLQGVKSIPQGCWPMLTPMLPTVVSSWLDVLRVVDHPWYTRETVECKKNSNVAVLDTNLWAYYHTLFKGTLIFCLAHSPSEWHTIHVSIISWLKNISLTCLLSFIYTDWSGFNKWNQ